MNYIFLKFLTEPTIWLKGCSIYYYFVMKIILQEGCVVCKDCLLLYWELGGEKEVRSSEWQYCSLKSPVTRSAVPTLTFLPPLSLSASNPNSNYLHILQLTYITTNTEHRLPHFKSPEHINICGTLVSDVDIYVNSSEWQCLYMFESAPIWDSDVGGKKARSFLSTVSWTSCC